MDAVTSPAAARFAKISLQSLLRSSPHPPQRFCPRTEIHMNSVQHRELLALLPVCFLLAAQSVAQENEASRKSTTPPLDQMAESMIFHASFDDTTRAQLSTGAGRLLMDRGDASVEEAAPQLSKGAGRYGDALRFSEKTKTVWYYEGIEADYKTQDWSGSFSFWLKLDPDQDLEPGFCDPVQITERAWNDAAFFVDFDKVLPRDFRLGVFADLKSWNPDNKPYDDIADEDRPLVTVKRPPFSSDAWTHVCFTWKDINSASGKAATAALYLNGELQGTLNQPIKFTWDPKQAKIKIGINYIGMMDDLIIFDSALSPVQVELLYGHPKSGLQR